MADASENGVTKDFSKVVLTLRNVLIPCERLTPTPSTIDGLDVEIETDLRILGCELIQTAGILLKLPQVAMAAGQILYQRFYFSKSFVKHNMEVLAMACINLASKIEEAPRRIRDVINVFHHIKQVRGQKKIGPLILDQNYVNLKNQVIKAERRVLNVLGFCVHVKHPHKIIVVYLQVLDAHRNQKLVQCAWNYMNDSFRTDVFVRFDPETIACACIFLAARQLQICLPDNPQWFSIFDVTEDVVREISLCILQLYTRKKPNFEYLEQKVQDTKNALIEAKRKAKTLPSESTPNSNSSRPSTPIKLTTVASKPSPNYKKSKHDDERIDANSNSKSRSGAKRRSLSYSRSRSASRSRSRTTSDSRSPPSPSSRKRYHTPPKKYRKTHRSDRHRRKHRRSYSRSYSKSPERYEPKSKKYSSRDRNESYSPYERSKSDRHDRGDRHDKYYKNSPSRKSKKHNGHRRSRSRDRYRH